MVAADLRCTDFLHTTAPLATIPATAAVLQDRSGTLAHGGVANGGRHGGNCLFREYAVSVPRRTCPRHHCTRDAYGSIARGRACRFLRWLRRWRERPRAHTQDNEGLAHRDLRCAGAYTVFRAAVCHTAFTHANGGGTCHLRRRRILKDDCGTDNNVPAIRAERQRSKHTLRHCSVRRSLSDF